MIRPALVFLTAVLAAAPGFAAKCLPDNEFSQYSRGAPGYNRQTQYPFWHVALNSSMGDGVLEWSEGPETMPPVHWSRKSVRLTWPEYTEGDFAGYLVQRIDRPYHGPANEAETLLNVTEAVRPNHASAFRGWYVFIVDEHGTRTEWASVFIPCGDQVQLRTGGMDAHLETAPVGADLAPDMIPYPHGTYANHKLWNLMVNEILEERRTGQFADPPNEPGAPDTVVPPPDREDPPETDPPETDDCPKEQPATGGALVLGLVAVGAGTLGRKRLLLLLALTVMLMGCEDAVAPPATSEPQPIEIEIEMPKEMQAPEAPEDDCPPSSVG